MESGNNIKSTKTTTTLLALVLVASFAGTMISMPKMIGSANAQSAPTSSKACPAGFTLKQGECTQPAVCPPAQKFGTFITGPTNGVCTICEIDNPSICSTVLAICPNGGQLIGNQCVTKPGNR